jgi:asparagine synthase (glutamine-hydrolysing)
MRYFVLLLDPEGSGVLDTMRPAYETLPRARGLEFEWQTFRQAAVLTAWDDNYGDALVTSDCDSVATGVVRLDNRVEVERWLDPSGKVLSDLELVRCTVRQYKAKYVHRLVGDFGFVVWNGAARTALAACDAFSVRKLYYAERSGVIAFASRAEVLALDEQYEPQHFAELVAMCSPSPELCAYAGVRAVPDGCMALLERGQLTIHRYWSASNFEPEGRWLRSEREAAETCRELLAESVRLRLSVNGDTWAQLSGGMDSSVVACMTQWLAGRGKISHGLAGTVTYVDRQGTASDERRYSDAVVARWGLRNEVIVDPPLWVDSQYPPSRTDQPRNHYPFYPRDLRLSTIVRAAGGRVILTGIGGDELFTGYTYFFADWLASGRVWPAVQEMVRRAAVGRVSFWELAYQNAVLPLLPAILRDRLVRAGGHVPAWIPSGVARRYALRKGTFSAAAYAGRIGHKAHHGVLTTLVGLGRLLHPGVMGDTLDVRHPFLYRPLVEFALRLPSEICARPNERKWVLREAMRGILPEVVRTRVGKGSPAELYAWSLAALRTLLDPLVQEPILADLGVIDARKLRAAFDAAPQQAHNTDQRHAMVYTTLAIEAWLQVRSGRWPRDGYRCTAELS